MNKTPYLSVVAVSRNDDHGGDPLQRTQLFIDSLAWQAKHFALSVELILVDWNPPANKQGLASVLLFPVNEYFTARIITVPPELHAGFRHGDRLPLFQMIGKNVGIRRAKGEFIVATNIDILFDDLLMEYIAKKNLSKNRMYRADRFDIDSALPSTDHQARQEFCKNKANLIRTNQRLKPSSYQTAQQLDPYNSTGVLDKKFRDTIDWATFDKTAPSITLLPTTPYTHLSTTACGDFTLLHKTAWATLRGYGEFEAYSMNIDSIGCIAAHLAGYLECRLLPPMVCYHIEHSSGWTLKGEKQLFERLTNAGIPLFDWEILCTTLFATMKQNPALLVNSKSWGLDAFTLTETRFTTIGKDTVLGEGASQLDYSPVAAIKQQYEPGIIYQTVYFNQSVDQGYNYYLTLTRHPLWYVVQLGIGCVKTIKKIGKFVLRKGSKKA